VRRENGRDALVSVGEDRRLVEYDLSISSVEHGLMWVGPRQPLAELDCGDSRRIMGQSCITQMWVAQA
jgi:hypothetical protein